MMQPHGLDRPGGGGTTLGQAVLAFSSGIAVIGVCAASVLFALGYTVEFVPGAGPRLVAETRSLPAPVVTAAVAPLPSRQATPSPPRSLPPAPRSAAPRVDQQASARRRRDGHFHFDAMVNGSAIQMMFDTGASFVTLRAEDAAKIGIDLGTLDYTAHLLTANGTSDNAPVLLASLTIGGITQHNVPALISKPGKLTVNLLGQTFMKRLAGFRFDGDQLVLEGN